MTHAPTRPGPDGGRAWRTSAARPRVSAQTVSRFYTGGTSPRRPGDRIERAVRELGYQQSRLPQILRAQHTDTIGFLAMGPLNYGNTGILNGISRAARAEGQSLLTAQLDLDPDAPSTRGEVQRALGNFTSMRVDGIVVGTPYLGVRPCSRTSASPCPSSPCPSARPAASPRSTPTPTAPLGSGPDTSWSSATRASAPGRPGQPQRGIRACPRVPRRTRRARTHRAAAAPLRGVGRPVRGGSRHRGRPGHLHRGPLRQRRDRARLRQRAPLPRRRRTGRLLDRRVDDMPEAAYFDPPLTTRGSTSRPSARRPSTSSSTRSVHLGGEPDPAHTLTVRASTRRVTGSD